MGGTVVRAGQPYSVDGSPITAKQQLVLGQAAFARTDDGTTIMAIDGRAGGTPVDVWDGDGSYWTAAGTGSATPGSKHTGTNGWDTGVTAEGNNTRFDGGADQDIAGTYSELTFWVQPKAYPPTSSLQVWWRNAAQTSIGNIVRVSDYTTNMDLDVWQKVTIPIADFGLTGDVDKIIIRYNNTAGQHYWFDNFQLVPPGGGGPYRFLVEAPDASSIYHVSMAVLVVSAPATGWSSTSFADIVGGLANGLIFRHRRKSTSEVLWALNSKDNVDLFGRYHPQDDITFSNGEMLVGFMVKPGLATVQVTNDDVLEFVVRDDLSGLTTARAYAHFGIEVIS